MCCARIISQEHLSFLFGGGEPQFWYLAHCRLDSEEFPSKLACMLHLYCSVLVWVGRGCASIHLVSQIDSVWPRSEQACWPRPGWAREYSFSSHIGSMFDHIWFVLCWWLLVQMPSPLSLQLPEWNTSSMLISLHLLTISYWFHVYIYIYVYSVDDFRIISFTPVRREGSSPPCADFVEAAWSEETPQAKEQFQMASSSPLHRDSFTGTLGLVRFVRFSGTAWSWISGESSSTCRSQSSYHKPTRWKIWVEPETSGA